MLQKVRLHIVKLGGKINSHQAQKADLSVNEQEIVGLNRGWEILSSDSGWIDF